jgi:DNA repair exonuclease SbcCD ATPase subunit
VSEIRPSLDAELERVREACEESAERWRQEQRALESVRSLVAALAEQSLRLHQRNLAIVNSMKEDLDRVKRQLKRLATARS